MEMKDQSNTIFGPKVTQYVSSANQSTHTRGYLFVLEFQVSSPVFQ